MFEQGYTIVDDLVTPDLLERLIAASRRCVQEAYESDDKNLHGGLVLKEQGEQGPHALRGVMMPGWNAPEYAEYMGSDAVVDYVRGFLNVEKEELMMPDADCILYVGHTDGSDRAQGWHRDSQEYLKKGFDEQSQREQYELLMSPEYWSQVRFCALSAHFSAHFSAHTFRSLPVPLRFRRRATAGLSTRTSPALAGYSATARTSRTTRVPSGAGGKLRSWIMSSTAGSSMWQAATGSGVWTSGTTSL